MVCKSSPVEGIVQRQIDTRKWTKGARRLNIIYPRSQRLWISCKLIAMSCCFYSQHSLIGRDQARKGLFLELSGPLQTLLTSERLGNHRYVTIIVLLCFAHCFLINQQQMSISAKQGTSVSVEKGPLSANISPITSVPIERLTTPNLSHQPSTVKPPSKVLRRTASENSLKVKFDTIAQTDVRAPPSSVDSTGGVLSAELRSVRSSPYDL